MPLPLKEEINGLATFKEIETENLACMWFLKNRIYFQGCKSVREHERCSSTVGAIEGAAVVLGRRREEIGGTVSEDAAVSEKPR